MPHKETAFPPSDVSLRPLAIYRRGRMRKRRML